MEIADHQIGGAVVDAEAFPDRPYVWLNGHDGSPVMPVINPPKYLPADRLWVRETHGFDLRFDYDAGSKVKYRATNGLALPPESGWKPSIHMRRSHSRLTLTVTDVRVQRLQDISEADARAEGVGSLESHMPGKASVTAREGFERLWDSLNANRAPWASNPWVVAISFDVHHINIDSMEAAA
jgi:hypothetical protein